MPILNRKSFNGEGNRLTVNSLKSSNLKDNNVKYFLSYESGNFEKFEIEKNAFKDLHSENCCKKSKFLISYGFPSLLSHSRSYCLSQKKNLFLDLLHGIPPLRTFLGQLCSPNLCFLDVLCLKEVSSAWDVHKTSIRQTWTP